MTKQDHIAYWKNSSNEDWETALYNYEGKRSVPALFFLHLSVEKMLKAIWVKDNLSNTPPFTHDLQKIAGETDLEWDAVHFDYLSVVNNWNIEARYPDYKHTLHKIATSKYMQMHVDKVKALLQWLQEKL
ncbi:MAG: HEPN domain-containing protein [Bacteroidetes bacterium]|nr:HEPN domain-containing protein [Bacteroidota bacterium]